VAQFPFNVRNAGKSNTGAGPPARVVCRCASADGNVGGNLKYPNRKGLNSMKTNANREKDDIKDDYTRPLSEMADTALKNYQQALHASLKLQEDAGRWWSSVWNQTTLSQDWQKRLQNMTGLATNLVPLAQRRMEEVIEFMEQNGRTGAELMKQAVDAAQTPAGSESQAKWMSFWTSSLGAVRSNTEAVSQISSKAIDSWIDFVRKNAEMSQARVSKAA
jgi:hypothetical protein